MHGLISLIKKIWSLTCTQTDEWSVLSFNTYFFSDSYSFLNVIGIVDNGYLYRRMKQIGSLSRNLSTTYVSIIILFRKSEISEIQNQICTKRKKDIGEGSIYIFKRRNTTYSKYYYLYIVFENEDVEIPFTRIKYSCDQRKVQRGVNF